MSGKQVPPRGIRAQKIQEPGVLHTKDRVSLLACLTRFYVTIHARSSKIGISEAQSMRRLAVFFAFALFAVISVYAQNNDNGSQPVAPGLKSREAQDNQDNSDQAPLKQVTLPAGTQVLLQLRSPIDTKSAHV